jgi:hypothetical protein
MINSAPGLFFNTANQSLINRRSTPGLGFTCRIGRKLPARGEQLLIIRDTSAYFRVLKSTRRCVAVCASRDEAKAALVAELEGSQTRDILMELVLALEAENPTESPTTSDLLAGQWKFFYSGSVAPGIVPSPTRPLALAMYAGGFTPGSLGLAVS